ncbi:NF-kappa-B inhibitor zeta [Protopterus annectens]|uniref:NF-kappa-B inhibitor zeta n=1 Tax=Protopterus annectens TaxID=7888 RepID=UPI001CF9E3D9|nr:NF-kappa-B inhibitor zeta [Protopterus annectens]
MIVDRITEENREAFVLEYGESPIFFSHFGESSPEGSEPSSPHQTYFVPVSPDSNSLSSSNEGCLSDAGISQASQRNGKRQIGGGRQHKGSFVGVRVKNPVKELLNHFRNQQLVGDSLEDYKVKGSPADPEQFLELKTILRNSKRNAPDDHCDELPCKRSSYESLPLLTPPHTPTSAESMDDKSRAESNSDALQTIINIKNESHPLSLNSVQVSWNNNLKKDCRVEDYLEVCSGASYSQSQNCHLQDTSPQHSIEQNFSCSFSPDLSLLPPGLQQYLNGGDLQDYQLFPADGQSNMYQQSGFGFHTLPFETQGQSFQSVLHEQSFPLVQPSGQTHSVMFNCSQNMNLSQDQVSAAVQSNALFLSSERFCQQKPVTETNPVQPGKSFFQWQIEQEENKLTNVTHDQLLAKDSDGDTLLHISVAQGRRALSYVLARKMAALCMLDVKEHNGQSALQVAVAANQHLIVQDLVSLGAQVNTTDCWGRTPLHVCAEKGFAQVLQALQKGARTSVQQMDLEATNYDGLTALHCAAVAHNAVVHELQRSQPRSPEMQELLLKNKGLVDTVKTLIQMGASVEAKDRKSGRTTLHLAAEEANVELLRVFLELPNSLCFVNAKAYSGNTALHVVSGLQYRVAQLDAVRLLMRKGADPSARNLENEQPVHLVLDGSLGEQVRRILKGKTVHPRTLPY